MARGNGYKVMSNHSHSKTDPANPMIYQIRLRGHLSTQWTEWFEDLTITQEEDGNTVLTGPVVDQSALHGLLKKVRDLGLPLVSVIPVQVYETAVRQQRRKMMINKRTSAMQDRKAVFSTIWIFLVANYIYCDVLAHMEPATINELITGKLGSVQVTQGFLLSAAIMMEIPFAMILLAQVLTYRVNRWANIIAGSIMAVIQVATMGMGTAPTLYYLFYSAIEVTGALFIIWLAWTWRNPED